MMDKPDRTAATNSLPSTPPMARIDGVRVRSLRESKGLTQLYLATVVGVTTDTISRWENRRYPSIKLENAEKLAQALEVELQAILEQDDGEPQPVRSAGGTGNEPPVAPPARRSRASWILLVALVAVLGAGVAGYLLFGPHDITVSAERILPAHVPAGQSFPVLIRVRMSKAGPVSLIIKEVLPPACVVVDSEPALTTFDARTRTVKWIRRAKTRHLTFAYVVRAPTGAVAGEHLDFAGSITLKQGGRDLVPTLGATTITVAPFHWADTNSDGIVDDEEILTVYDRYSDMPDLKFGRNLIDNIWAGRGYYWDHKTGKYVVLE
ncbi:MAG: helix-turn-helix transcriptional regulator [Deltaproteobacteria bacterium]|nr:helix-turn-helix transcriptional regulator [Deltaproteobacteria bacterium]